eukprot:CAMPEP_0194215798 /NCGR_PEP_ID=MMETSP0156-20130528/17839_1 /TAXON_ID=33649 /ORGANISM="Thalassionema nitzschioides, Strain L26-B" /LENGTH=376 /DNA_ID=CAMNT_0038944413 /DNA_START=309 /DNA_END=1439 /DNA_ORIENTATION=+
MVKEDPELRHVQSLFLSLQMACKTISNLVNRAGLVYGVDRSDAFVQEWNKQQQQTELQAGEEERIISNTTATTTSYPNDGRFYSMKRLDQLSTNVLRNALRFTGKVHMVTPTTSRKSEQPAEHQPGVLIASALDSDYVAVLDPMDGSGNADASICTGTVFGIFEAPNSVDNENEENQQRLVESVLQPAKNMRAAGYCLYSSATVLVFTFGNDVMGFTLDPQLNEFVLTHPKLTIPARGNVYSCNEANSEGWSEDFQSYLKALKMGNNRGKTRYAHRYVGSMVGDIHRTLLYGGIFCYPCDTLSHPRGNLQLLYKSAPLAFLVTCAGGRSLDGETGDLLDVTPKRVHQKFPCFMGSPEDVEELESYIMPKKKHGEVK